MPARALHLAAPLRLYWHLLSEVPGWPDAPLRRRLLRILPILLPLFATALALTWRHAYHAPAHQRLLDAYSPLLGLEAEVQDLRLAASGGPVPASADALDAFLSTTDEAAGVLGELRQKIAALDWTFSYQIGEPLEPSAETPLLRSVPVRAKLAPAFRSAESFHQLLSVLALFPQQSKRLDLMRLALRADDKGKLHADLNLRLTLIQPPGPTPADPSP